VIYQGAVAGRYSEMGHRDACAPSWLSPGPYAKYADAQVNASCAGLKRQNSSAVASRSHTVTVAAEAARPKEQVALIDDAIWASA
jgi:hypothetical protein